jgi:D-serine deaminase-like pyridoxal phosphate-dependent protein
MEKVKSADDMWYQIKNTDEINSPGLLVYPDRIERNIQKMVMIAGDIDKLRPHVKTHKMSEIIRLQMKHGIKKFKCATISETEMVARCEANNILLAMQPQKVFSVEKGVSGNKDILHH